MAPHRASLLLAVASCHDISASDFGPAAPFENFWGTHPVLQVWLETGGAKPLGRKLWRSDDAWLAEKLPMLPKGQRELTLPFGEGRRISAVRILGGWAQKNADGTFTPQPEFDVVARDSSGALQYNWTKLDSRVEPWVAAGLTPSPIVLDNVPYAFVKPENQFFQGLGMGAAPDDPAEFGSFVEAMVSHLAERFGTDEVARWRFRLGTEAQNSRMGPAWTGPSGNEPVPMTLVNGSEALFKNGLRQYLDTYAAAAAAVKKVSPASAFGPCNFAGLGLTPAPAAAGLNAGPTNYDLQLDAFADELYAKGLPMDFAAVSDYSDVDGHGNSPAEPMGNPITKIAQVARRAHTGTNAGEGSPVPMEAMEYGWATWAPHNAGQAPPLGAWGAAWNAASYLWMRERGADQIFHWYGFDRSIGDANRSYCNASRDQVGRPLVDGFGWVMSMLELLKGGGNAAANQDALGAQFVRDNVRKGFPYDNTFGAWRAAQKQSRQLHYLFVSFSSNHTADERETSNVVLRVTAADFPDGSPFFDLASKRLAITERVLNPSSAVHDAIRADLAAAGELEPATSSHVPFEVKKMATPKGLALAARHAEHYMDMNAASLSARPFSGSVSYDADTKELILTISDVRPPHLQVISIAEEQTLI